MDREEIKKIIAKEREIADDHAEIEQLRNQIHEWFFTAKGQAALSDFLNRV